MIYEFKRNQGFTLLEILIVIVLMALFTTFVLPRIQSNLNLHLKKQARMLSGTIQYLYNQAAMKNVTYRLHYDLDNQRYWIESSKEKVTLTPQKPEPPFRDKPDDGPQFISDTSLLKKPVMLKKRIRFKDIKTQTHDAITSGDAYTHFFPHGYVEETTIRLESQTGGIYTIVVNPLTGKAKVYDFDLENRP